jgi:hypothetical protein
VVFEVGMPWITDDGGASWNEWSLSPPRSRVPSPETRLVSPEAELRGVRILDADWDANPDAPRLFLATDHGVWISDDGFVDEGLPSISFESIAYDPQNEFLVVGSANQGGFGIQLPGGRLVESSSPNSARVEISEIVARPNPFRQETVLSFGIVGYGAVGANVYDIAGRRVRILREDLFPGSNEIAWDGLDDAGRRAAPGTYFVRLHAEGTSRSARVVLLR